MNHVRLASAAKRVRSLAAATVFAATPLVPVSLTPALLVAQGTPVVNIGRTDLSGAVTAHLAADAALRALIDGAPARGVPAEALLTKVREGIAKGSNDVRIREAVRLLAQRLETARRSLDPAYSVGELTAGAGALQSGVAPSTLRDLRKAWPDRPLTVPLGVLTEMVADGVPLKSASTRLRDLMSRGANGAQLIAMGTSIRSDVAAGYEPGTALELRAKGVLSLLANPFKSSIAPSAPPIRPR